MSKPFSLYLTGDADPSWQSRVKEQFPEAKIVLSALPHPGEGRYLLFKDLRTLLETAGPRVMALFVADVVLGKTSKDPLCQALLNSEFGLARGRSADTLIILAGEPHDLDQAHWMPAAMVADEAHDSLESAIRRIKTHLHELSKHR